MERAKRIVFDLSSYQGESGFRGVGRVAWEVFGHLIKLLDKSWHIHVILCSHFNIERGAQIRESLLNLREEIKIEVFEPIGFNTYFDILLQDYEMAILYDIALEYFISQVKPDVYFNPSHFEWDHPTSIKKLNGSWKDFIVLHDLIPFLFQEIYLSSEKQKKWYYHKLDEVTKADFYFAISNSTKEDFVKHLNFNPEKIKTTYIDTNFNFRKLNRDEKKEAIDYIKNKFAIEKFILYVPGGFDYRKNFHNLFKAYGMLPEEIKKSYKLVLVSKIDDAMKNNLYSIAKDSGVEKENIVFTGYVSDDELNFLYNLTSLFVYPSLYEGFGLPVLEAMRAGAPVIGSDCSSIKEIILEKEAMFDPENPEDISRKIAFALKEKNYREFLTENSELQQKRFSWDKTAEIIASTIQELVND